MDGDWIVTGVADADGSTGGCDKADADGDARVECACVGGGSNVPLGFVSLTENLFMIGMGLWMGFKAFA